MVASLSRCVRRFYQKSIHLPVSSFAVSKTVMSNTAKFTIKLQSVTSFSVGDPAVELRARPWDAPAVVEERP